MDSPHWLQHWPQRRTHTTFYDLADGLGHRARVPAHQITSTVSAWLAELGVQSPLVDDLESAVRGGDWYSARLLGERLSVDVTLAE